MLEELNMKVGDINLYEINEAFAIVPFIAIQDNNIDPERVNVNGGAIALGHPLGCSGARIVVALCHNLRMMKKRFGIAAICNGGGEAVGIFVENTQLQ